MEHTKASRTFKDYLIPYYSCSYKTKLSKETIYNKLSKRTEPEKFFRKRGVFFKNENTKDFEGVVNNTSFKINKISSKKKSNTPIILGELLTSNQYTEVKLKFRPNLLIMIIAPIWAIVISFNLFYKEDFNFEFTDNFNLTMLLPLLVIAVAYLFITISFNFSVTKNLKILEEIIAPEDDVNVGASWIVRN